MGQTAIDKNNVNLDSKDQELEIDTKISDDQNIDVPKVVNTSDSTDCEFSSSDTSFLESSIHVNSIDFQNLSTPKEDNLPIKAEEKIDSPEVNNLDLKLSLNTSDVVTNVSNTSNEYIGNSQNDLTNIDTPLKLLCATSMARKRRRPRRDPSDEYFSDSSEYAKETPRKKKRVSKTATTTKSDNKIDPSYIVRKDNFESLGIHESQSKSTDFSKLDIVIVTDREDVFKNFHTEIRNHKEISISIGCVEVQMNKQKIGVKPGKSEIKQTDELKQKSSKTFSYGRREVKGVSIGWGGNTAYYVSFEPSKVPIEDKINILTEVLANPRMKVKMFDGKEHIKVITLCLDIELKAAIEDPKIADWILDPDGQEKNLQAMALKYAPETANLFHLVGHTKGVGSIGLNITSTASPKLRSAVECVVTWQLVRSVVEEIAKLNMKLLHAYYIEMAIIRILARMELIGFGVNLPRLEELSNTLVKQNTALEQKAFQIAGRTFSFSSSADVAKILGMYNVKKRISTNKQALEHLKHPIASLVVQWRKINSILTKTIYPVLRLVKNNRIYGNCILQNSTGRISMHEPNLQSVPRNFETAFEENKKVMINCRDVFEAKDQHILVSADYCQLELRLLAHFSKDKYLLQALQNTNKDVFKAIAGKIHNISDQQVSDEMRQNAKRICYGIIYGMGIKTLAEQMDTSEEEACIFVEMFHEKYPMVRQFIQKLIERCKVDGYVETLGGRRRYLPQINSSHYGSKSQAERKAVNTVIQGSAADIAKNAMVVIDVTFKQKFKSSRNKPELVLHLHDEFLYEVPEKHLLTTAKIIKKCMESSVQLSVPFPVKVAVGKSWGMLQEKSLTSLL